jgi:probable HAF family extracellular repeat protein
MIRTVRVAWLVGLLVVVLPLPAAAQYLIVELPALTGAVYGEATAINDRGDIVGRNDVLSDGQIAMHAVLWKDGQTIDLGMLPGGEYSYATGINNRGQVVGVSQTTGGNCDPFPFTACEHGFLWENGVMTDLGAIAGAFSQATAINDRGQIVGSSTTTASGDSHAVLWDDGRIVDLGTLPDDNFGGSGATAINNRGQIVGLTSGTTTRAWIWENGTMSLVDTQGGTFSMAVDINDRGQIVGVADRGTTQPSLLWDRGTPTILPLLPGADFGEPTAVNSRGQSVGWVVFRDENMFAVTWQNGAEVELPTLPASPDMGSVTAARDVNNQGHIVGTSQGHAVLWVRGWAGER